MLLQFKNPDRLFQNKTVYTTNIAYPERFATTHPVFFRINRKICICNGQKVFRRMTVFPEIL